MEKCFHFNYEKTLETSYCFDDVLLRPRESDIASRSEIDLGVNLGTKHRSLKLKIPLISSPMDTVTESKMAINMALNGGIGIIHRYMTVYEQITEITKVKRHINYIFPDPYKVNNLITYQGILNHIEKTGVTTICIFSKNPPFPKFEGIITNRNLQKLEVLPIESIINKTVKELDEEYHIMTPFDKLIYMSYNHQYYKDMIKDNTSPHFEDCMVEARDLMNENNIEKIPIFKMDEGGNPTNIILGIITRRSIEHYFNNRTRAALDKSGSLVVGAAIGIRGEYLEDAKKLVEAGVDLLCIDVANGHNTRTIKAVEEVRKLFPDIVIMVGNVCTGHGYYKLAKSDCDCIRVGIGNGSICSTRLETGVGFGQFSSVNECYDIKRRYFLDTHIICDGGSLGKTGNKVKALASGSSAIIMGKTLASCEESPGSIIIRNGKRMKYYRGMASTMANISKREKQMKEDCASTITRYNNRKRKAITQTAEGVDGVIDLKGSVEETLNQICGAIRSGLSYQGCRSIEELHELRKNYELRWGVITSIGMSETGIRVKTF